MINYGINVIYGRWTSISWPNKTNVRGTFTSKSKNWDFAKEYFGKEITKFPEYVKDSQKLNVVIFREQNVTFVFSEQEIPREVHALL